MDATWHARSRGSATEAHAAPMWRMYSYILHILYSKGIQPSVYRKGIQPTNPSGLIKSTCFFNFFCVGVSPTQLFLFQATWLTEERSIGGAFEIRTSIAWT